MKRLGSYFEFLFVLGYFTGWRWSLMLATLVCGYISIWAAGLVIWMVEPPSTED